MKRGDIGIKMWGPTLPRSAEELARHERFPRKAGIPDLLHERACFMYLITLSVD
jgi:hypothetical protein